MDRLHVILHAVSSDPADAPAVEIPVEGKLRLVTTCRLERWKGVDGLVRLLTAFSDLGLVVIGDGPERHVLERTAQELGIASRVFFAGRVETGCVDAYLRRCDIFVLNSEAEGSPHAILEAVLAGLPVLATDVGGIPELIEDHVSGRLVPPRDFKAMEAALGELMDKRLRDRYARVAQNILTDRPLEDSIARLAEILTHVQREG